jgi:hypothetical protein
MDGRIPTAGGGPVKVDGKKGFAHSAPPEADAFNRWQKREFLHVEREFARGWRAALNGIDLVTIAEGMRAMGITPRLPRPNWSTYCRTPIACCHLEALCGPHARIRDRAAHWHETE